MFETPSEKSRGAGCLPVVAGLVIGTALVVGYAGRAAAQQPSGEPSGEPADRPEQVVNAPYQPRRAWHLLDPQ